MTNDKLSPHKHLTARLEACLTSLVALTFFARFYLPTEDAAGGATLWIVAFWLVIGLFTLLLSWRHGGAGRRFDGSDAGVLLLIGGQVASAMAVVVTTGDKRAAVNLAWEWIGAGIVWFVLRSRVITVSFREGFVRASILTGCVLAGLGVWQHLVSHPALVRDYGPLFDQLRTAAGGDAEAIQRKLAAAGIPTEGPALTLFEKRLRDSREPMGFFGLANTFGGCLAVWFVLTLGTIVNFTPVVWSRWNLISARLDRSVAQRAASLQSSTEVIPKLISRVIPADVTFLLRLAVLALIVWCLLLTKSRTALLAAMCGSAILVSGQLLSSLKLSRSTLQWFRRVIACLAIGIVLSGMVVGTLIQSGGLDIEVLTESSKSASYRLQYWQATSRLVAAHPWLGVGPGNFRQHYLKYKLPAASEEIADPHNLFFDVAATGGLVSLAGLVLLLALAFRMRLIGIRESCDTTASGQPTDRVASSPNLGRSQSPVSAFLSSSTPIATWTFWFAGAAPLLAFAGLMSLNGEWDDRLLVLPCVWFCVAGIGSWLANVVAAEPRDVALWFFTAAVVLVVHLLGAGGISMPAVSQLLFCLVAFSLAQPVESSEPGGVSSRTLHVQNPRANAARLTKKVSLETMRATVTPATTPRRFLRPLRAMVLVGWAVTVTAFMATTFVPVVRSQSWLEIGNRLAISRAGRSGAEAAFRAACLADEWFSTPWHRRAELAYELAARDRFRSNELFEAAVKLLLDSMDRDPHNFQGPRTLGNWWLMRWQVTQQADDARQALVWLRRAREFYPTNAALQAELSQAATAAKEFAEALSAAHRALEQEELNRRLGHVDRYLTSETLTRLQRLEEPSQLP